MPGALLRACCALVLACVVAVSSGGVGAADRLSDAPEHPRDPTVAFKTADSYEGALSVWKTPEDVSAWIAGNFSYDTARAMRLSETQRAAGGGLAIHTPAELFASPSGVCVDLSRFGVEALRSIAPETASRYLMIEFDPAGIAGSVLRRHWVATFTRDGRTYVYADSKRPGHIAGPYADAGEFVRAYEQYRGRRIVAFRELDSYQKQRRARAARTDAAAGP
jgi:hypothetical protein